MNNKPKVTVENYLKEIYKEEEFTPVDCDINNPRQIDLEFLKIHLRAQIIIAEKDNDYVMAHHIKTTIESYNLI